MKKIFVIVLIIVCQVAVAMEPSGLRHRRPSRLQRCMGALCDTVRQTTPVMGLMAVALVPLIEHNKKTEYFEKNKMSFTPEGTLEVVGNAIGLYSLVFASGPFCCHKVGQLYGNCKREFNAD